VYESALAVLGNQEERRRSTLVLAAFPWVLQ